MKHLNTYLKRVKLEKEIIRSVIFKTRFIRALEGLLGSSIIFLPIVLVISNSFIYLNLIYFLVWTLCLSLILWYSLFIILYHKALFYPKKKPLKLVKITNITIFSIIMIILFILITIIIGGQL